MVTFDLPLSIASFCDRWGINFSTTPDFIFPINNHQASGLNLVAFLDKPLYRQILGANTALLHHYSIDPANYDWMYLAIDSFFYLEVFDIHPHLCKEIDPDASLVDFYGPISNPLGIQLLNLYHSLSSKQGAELIYSLPLAHSPINQNHDY